jgi:hypothetical protein
MEDRGPAGRITRDVDPTAVSDLLSAPPRATVAFAEEGEVSLLPARASCERGVHRFGVETSAAPDLDRREVVLVRDDGPYWFQPRGISVRGTAVRSPSASGEAGDSLSWYALEPSRVLAWDYRRLRRE